MKIHLIRDTFNDKSAVETIMRNRGIPPKEIEHYLHTTDADINSYELLCFKAMKQAGNVLFDVIKNLQHIYIVVDSDMDGFASSAILINYLYALAPYWAEDHIHTYFHEGKQHGLSDCVDFILEQNPSLVICPDSATNDVNECNQLVENGIAVIALDHHEKEYDNPNLILINNQTCDYPNKFLCGAGVTWQFCKYLDNFLNKAIADNFLDLVALAETGDMMSLLDFETRHLITKGFRKENVQNPFILKMWEKNKFKLGDNLTSWGTAFYIVPFVNAIVRSGTLEEKRLIFDSMLESEAYRMIPSTKRGHKFGDHETVVDQAIRTCTNVKNRQAKVVEKGKFLLEKKIEDENLLRNKVILLLIRQGEIDSNIAGLIANQLVAKYQKPCCILTLTNGFFRGSARGCEKAGITDFKKICEDSGVIEYALGHSNAMGLSIPSNFIQDFLINTNRLLADFDTTPQYEVDYLFEDTNVDPECICEIGSMNNLWGKDFEESLIAIKHLKIYKNMLTLMSPDKSPTIKITLPNGLNLLKFKATKKEFEQLDSFGYVEINLVGKCNVNIWNGQTTPQIFIEEYEIINEKEFIF